MVFGSPDNFQSEKLIFDIAPFCSGYHALLGRTAFAGLNVVPHYAYLKLKMPGPSSIITVNGNIERSLRTEEHTVALAAEVQSSLFRQNLNSGHRQTSPNYSAAGQSSPSRARLAIRPLSLSQSSGDICAART